MGEVVRVMVKGWGAWGRVTAEVVLARAIRSLSAPSRAVSAVAGYL